VTHIQKPKLELGTVSEGKKITQEEMEVVMAIGGDGDGGL